MQLSQRLSHLNNKAYIYHIIMRFINAIAFGILLTSSLYELYNISKSSYVVSLVGYSYFIPSFFLMPYAGHILDKKNKYRIFIQSNISIIFFTLLLAIIDMPFLNNYLNQYHYFIGLFLIISVCIGCGRAFTFPLAATLLKYSNIEKTIGGAVSLHLIGFHLGFLLGSIMSGFIIAHISIYSSFFIATILLSINLIYIVKFKKQVPAIQEIRQDIPYQAQESMWTNIKDGLLYLKKEKILLQAAVLDLLIVIFGSVTAIIPEFSNKILHVGSEKMGVLNGADSIGALIALGFLSYYRINKNQGRILLTCTFVFGLLTILFSLSSYYPLALFIIILAGTVDGVSMLIRHSILQIFTTKDKIGRVSSVFSLLIDGSNLLGIIESGIAYAVLGLIPSILFGGFASILIAILFIITSIPLKKLSY